MGVFASYPSMPANKKYVFPHSETKPIIEYNGEKIDNDKLYRRYRDKTGPYAFQSYDKKLLEDGACKRGVGTLINHKRGGKVKIKPHQGKFKVFATQSIKNGEELFTNYGNNYRFGEGRYSTKRKSAYRKRNR